MLGFRFNRVTFRVTLFLILCVVAFVGWLMQYVEMRGPAATVESVIVTIPHHTSVAQVGKLLAEAGLIHNDIRFQILVRITGYSKKLQAGEIRLSTGRTPVEVLQQLSVAQSVQHPVTIPEGLRAEDIAKIFADGGWCDYNDFLHLIHDQGLIRSLGFDSLTSLEGYLFPDTYYLIKMSSDARTLIKMMVQRFRKVWGELGKETEGNIGLHDTVVLASVIEKETANPVERPIIASVFLNRLKQGMRLQSDPTVIYGIKNFSGNLTKDDLQTYTPYNTYLTPALPAGPICNPGKEALRAVLHPGQESYLFFVSKNDGTHQFSNTLPEHNQAVQKYQRDKTNQGKGK
jgi:UPF0755 protein